MMGSNCMSPNSGNPRDLALHRLTVAKEDLATAKDDFIGKHFRAANNRAYYSIYHSLTAVLALEQVASSISLPLKKPRNKLTLPS
ncbi:HEPN domain-containing protein [Enterocloster clostridioformis]|uniref:HEPN domain-containing protein n=2 Tax=Enterocloster clostridioformis TaxID=1531 RepID=UPI002E21545D